MRPRSIAKRSSGTGDSQLAGNNYRLMGDRDDYAAFDVISRDIECASVRGSFGPPQPADVGTNLAALLSGLCCFLATVPNLPVHIKRLRCIRS